MENNLALARLLLYYAVTFHRSIQMDEAAIDINDYPTIYHFWNAASHRTICSESLVSFLEKLLEMAKGTHATTTDAVMLPNPTGVYTPSCYRTSDEDVSVPSSRLIEPMPAGSSITRDTP